MTNQAHIAINQLTICFGQNKAVDRLDFSMAKGACVGLVGESGSGKSLSAAAMLQLLPNAATVSYNSQIIFNQQDILSYSESQMRQLRGRKIGMIFQDAMSAFNPVFTVGYQISEVLMKHLGVSKRQSIERAHQLLSEVGIKDPIRCYRSYAHELSGGMRQRAMIAMAISAEPEVLIADEPTTALDVTIQAQVIELLNRLKQQRQMTLLFISHDLAVVSKLADEVVVLQKGVKVEQASALIFFQQPRHVYSRQLIDAIPTNSARHHQTDNTPTLLSVNNLRVYFAVRSNLLRRKIDEVKAVDDISFDLKRAQTLALVGESGSGKTTTAKAISQLIPTTSGSIVFEHEDLLQIKNKRLRQLKSDIQIIFQDPYSSLNPRLLVRDSIAEGLIAQGKFKHWQAAEQAVDQALQQVGLETEMKWRYPHEFSGGQRQRICIARALVLKPKLLILDEPTSALDVSIQMQILALLDQLQQQLGLSYLLITHNLGIVAYLAHRVAVMYQGKIVEQGLTADILHRPQQSYTQQLLASLPIIS